jgi:mannan endo-1,4-beta-mannosidase
MKHLFLVIAICCIFYTQWLAAQQTMPGLADKHATAATKALYRNLHQLSGKHILFGHQHATEYGHGWQGEEGRSDVKSVTGSHPAVIGADLSGLTNSSLPDTVIEKIKQGLRQNISATYNRGGVTTLAWHFSNPLSAGGFYWKDSVSVPAVRYLIPGGSGHEKYKNILKVIAGWAKTVRGNDGQLVPMIFRPYHEFDGDWFWWGKAHCSKEEFISLWKFTVAYLRDSLQVHNFIYAFSPDCKFNTAADYLDRYPGNEWVDLLGMDDYADFGRDGKYDTAAGIHKLQIVNALAVQQHKLAAFTETGLESIPNTEWWTGILLKAVKTAPLQLCYVLVWRNDARSATHFYAPFPGQLSSPDFIRFYDDPFTWFEKDLPPLYK